MLNPTNAGVIDREEYYPFGETALHNTNRKRYRFTGKEKDNESGLYHYGARYYSPSAGCIPLIVNYFIFLGQGEKRIIQKVDELIEQNKLIARKYVWLYFLLTLLFMALSGVWANIQGYE